MEIVVAESLSQIGQARELFREYEASLGIRGCFQNFERELAELPGEYALPCGRLLLAVDDETPVGCVALRKLGDSSCEMRRLYLRPGVRSRGWGRRLAVAAIDEARRLGYQMLRLHTLPAMQQACALYRALGFGQIEPYTPLSVSGAVFLELPLQIAESVRSFVLKDLLREQAWNERAWLEFLRVSSLSMGVYHLKAGQRDPQRPHTEDEVYYVVSGRARFRAAGLDQDVGPGTVLFVKRTVEHRFHDITEDLTVLVFFAPSEGSLVPI